ncbi:response regulator [Roseovarius arcticus]|uniref:response regulator n=1 Tax=Roseovarius arcticus TaxID=2547404 RepID=UPI001110DE49|nr:response regulator [Roseovarius arcticus]
MSAPEKRCRILVVEDEWLIAMDTAMMIEDEGHVVVGPAPNVVTAMDLIQNGSIDAAFLDITLGAETSFPIAEKLSELGVPVTFVSAYGKKEIPSQFRNFDMLSKPIMSTSLVRQMDKMLSKT